ncbi:hypothetical protein AVEN_196063-1 [Araneus ventricosus]|uniref:Uncharacterized protein n=1 Tax=Araneus ventricosus TaxID=182803 RepID=A0A4Y1ZJW2_ARAVE|nr:hypothetical protein AVEN_196063-1 [Araneus ventricosus]
MHCYLKFPTSLKSYFISGQLSWISSIAYRQREHQFPPNHEDYPPYKQRQLNKNLSLLLWREFVGLFTSAHGYEKQCVLAHMWRLQELICDRNISLSSPSHSRLSACSVEEKDFLLS